jgi:hypothetical protein
MVKTTKKKQMSRKTQKPKKTKGKGRGSSRLDEPAREFAKLLNDPCYGRIVAPVYGSSGSGNLMRLESDFILGAEATSVGAACIFVPGLLSSSTYLAGVVTPSTVVNSDSGAIVWSQNYPAQPGAALVGSIGTCRAVSACMQVSFLGSELNRSGVVSLTQTSYGNAAGFLSLAAIRSGAERVVKLPDGTLEIKLVPTAKNADFNQVAGAKSDAVELPALTMSVSGIPSSTGVRVRLVQVLEWQPTQNTGIVNNTIVSKSYSTLQAVVSEMNEKRPGWQYELITGLGAYAAKTITWI